MKQVITIDRIKAIIAPCKTPQQVREALKRHKIKYKSVPYSESNYNLNITIPTKTGTIKIYRTCSRRDPFYVQLLSSVLFIPYYTPRDAQETYMTI